MDSTCIATGSNIKFITCFLNSKVGHYQLNNSPQTGTGDLIVSVQAINPIIVPKISKSDEVKFSKLIEEIKEYDSKSQTFMKLDNQINQLVFDLFDFSKDEVKFIESL